MLMRLEEIAKYAPEIISIAQVMREEETDVPGLLLKMRDNEILIEELKNGAIQQHKQTQHIAKFIEGYDKYVQDQFKRLTVFENLSIDLFGTLMIEIARDVEEADNRLSNVGTAEQIQAVVMEERANGPKSAMKLAVQFLGEAGMESRKTQPVLSSIKTNMMKLTEMLRLVEQDHEKIFNQQKLQQLEMTANG